MNTPAQTTPPNRRYQIGLPVLIIVITLALIGVMRALKSKPPEAQKTERSWPVNIITLASGSHHSQLRLLGKVETSFQSTLSAAVTADVAELTALEGSYVKAGDKLLRLDDREARLQLAQRSADLAELRALRAEEVGRQQAEQRALQQEQSLLALTEKALKREEQLKQSNLNSEARLDQARQSLQTARLALNNRQVSVQNQAARMSAMDARISRADAMLAQAKLDLERTRVVAPFDSIISKVQVSPGERVRPGEPLISLYASDKLEVRAQIPQRWLDTVRSALSQGKSLTAQVVPNLGESSLQLARLSGQINAASGGVDALFTTQNGQIPGALNETRELLLELPATDNLFPVPVSALYGTDTLYRVTDERLEAIKVGIHGERFDQQAQVLLINSTELKNGDLIVTTQLPNAIHGLKVSIRQPGAQQGVQP